MNRKEVTKKILFVLIVAFVYGLFANLAHPITPAYLEKLNITSSFGYLLAALNMGVLLTAPLWGSLGDVKNRKSILIFGFVVYAIGQVMFGLFSTTILIMLARFIAGIGNAAIAVSMLSYISKSEILAERKKEITASYIVMQVLGNSLGSAVGGIVGDSFKSDYSFVFYIQALLLFLLGVSLIFIGSMKDEVKSESRSKNPFASLKDITKLNPFYIIFLTLLFLIGISFTNITKYLDMYLNDLGHTAMFIGIYNLILGIVTLIASVVILPRVNKKVDSYKGSIIFSIIAAISVFLSFNFTGMVGIFSFYFLYIIAKTILEPLTVNTLSNNEVVPVGILMGVRQSFISLGAIVGMIVGGYIYNYNRVLLFNTCAILFLIAAVTMILIRNMKGR